MADVQIVRFVNTADGLRAGRDWVSKRLNHTEILALGPTRAAADEFAREVSPIGSIGLHRATLLQLATALSLPTVAKRDLAPLSRLGAEALAARVTHRLQQSERLSYFGPVAKLPGSLLRLPPHFQNCD